MQCLQIKQNLSKNVASSNKNDDFNETTVLYAFTSKLFKYGHIKAINDEIKAERNSQNQ